MSTIDTSSLFSSDSLGFGFNDFSSFDAPPIQAPVMPALEPSDHFGAAFDSFRAGDLGGAGQGILNGMGAVGDQFKGLFNDIYALPSISGTDRAPGIAGPVFPMIRAFGDALDGTTGGASSLGSGFSAGFDGGLSRDLLGLGGNSGQGMFDIGRNFGSIFGMSPFGLEDAAILGITRRGAPLVDDLLKLDRFNPPSNGWTPKPFDSSATDINSAIQQAFDTVGLPKHEFNITQWGEDAFGKSHPVEWFHPTSKAEVNIDFDPFALDGPQSWHVGLKMPGGDRSLYPQFGYVRHIEVPFPTILDQLDERAIFNRLRPE